MAMLPHFDVGLPQEWLPDETLFSLCSRYHQASGNRRASVTCQALFGHPQQGCAHDFPARLEHFCQISGQALGSAESIVEHHTILPLYLRFANADHAQKAILAVCGGSVGSLKFQLGLLTSRFRANHPMKACPVCMHNDRERFATAYWHREHQLPGVWVCRHHGCWLTSSDLKSTGVARFQWMLPTSAQFPQIDATPPSHSAIRLGNMVVSVGTTAGLHFTADILSQAFREALHRKGLLKGTTHRLKREAAGHSYAEFLKPLLRIEQLGALPASVDMASTDISRLLGARTSGIHPMRQLALAAWLFEDLGDLLAASASEITREVKIGRLSSSKVSDDRKETFFSLLASGNSATSAARSVGVDTTTGLAWCAIRGIASARRPKTVTSELRAKLSALLRRGRDKAEVAAVGKVSVQTITTLLRTEVGLHEAWKQAGFEKAQRRNRRLWTRAMSDHPLSGVKAARMRAPAVYAWLYRNDRDWLAARQLEMVTAETTGRRCIDWDARDTELATLVRQVALELKKNNPDARIKLFQLYQKIPELKAKLSKLDRLPLTRAATYSALANH